LDIVEDLHGIGCKTYMDPFHTSSFQRSTAEDDMDLLDNLRTCCCIEEAVGLNEFDDSLLAFEDYFAAIFDSSFLK
jgi:hypothetical protein